MDQPPVILWFRQDLRLADNQAVTAAVKTGQPILPIYILDDLNPGRWKMGAASRVWLHHSLRALGQSLENALVFRQGEALAILTELIQATGATQVLWNRCYEPWAIQRDTLIKEFLKKSNIKADSFNASLLYEPWQVLKPDGTPYQVFTPFYRKGCTARNPPPLPEKSPNTFKLFKDKSLKSDDLKILLPNIRWDTPLIAAWTPGEQGALNTFNHFIEENLEGYGVQRDFPATNGVSRLSPHLHFGEISPRSLWHTLQNQIAAAPELERDGDKFLSELGWREFAHTLLYHHPSLPDAPLQSRFANFPWQPDAQKLQAWQRGETGYPIVDAGMRQLWQTGWMHNRVRMIVASFLIKDLLIPWQTGAAWFWDTLVDADLANNSAGWQWVAGCGADAAPFFRIFNPVTQGQKFDPHGDYVCRYVPELAKLPTDHIHAPWLAPATFLKDSGITIGRTYPAPIIDHSAARQRALTALASIKSHRQPDRLLLT